MAKQLLFLFCIISISLTAQIPDEATPMRVVRCSAVDANAAIRNIYVDENDVKWVATNTGIFKIFSADNAAKEIIPPNSWSLLRFKGGNELLHLAKDKMTALLQAQNPEMIELDKVTASYLDKKKKELWVGTSHSGLYQFKIGADIQLMNHYTSDNSKLKSNYINAILIDRYGRQWIGTKKGVLYGKNGIMKLYERKDNIIAITTLGPDVWILGDQILWQVDLNNRWMAGDVDGRFAEGEIRDIEYDSEGRLWVASDIIVRYDVVKDVVERYTKANGFASKEINVITVDQEDALWVGTQDMGLFLIEKETVMTVSCAIEKGLSCDGNKKDAALKVSVIGGTEPLQYKWNINHSTANPTNLGPGIYEVTVTDADGKTRSAKAKIDQVKITAQINVESSASGEDRADGRASVDVTGGVPDYKYSWDNGENTFIATKLLTGEHFVTITDKMGCSTAVRVDIPLRPEPELIEEEIPVAEAEAVPPPIIEEPEEALPALQISIPEVIKLNCADEKLKSIPLEVSGGKAPYGFIWSDASINNNQIQPGIYSVTVIDAAQNRANKSFTISAPEALMINVQQQSAVSEKGKRDGAALASAKGGTGKYLWLWDNGERQATAKKLTFGKHSVTLTDANGCQATANISISEKAVPELSVNTLRHGQTIQLKKLYFKSDSTNIEPPSIPTLNEVFQFLKNNSKVVVEVGGHTNNIPAHTFCDRLSTARAKAVADFLITQGIQESRVVYKGYGKRKPIASNRTKEGRARNQRVELKILSLGD